MARGGFHGRRYPFLAAIPKLATLILLSAVHIGAQDGALSSVTISDYPAVTFQRHCGQGCLEGIEGFLGCSWNGCFCGPQYQTAASSYITSCWTSNCGSSTMVDYDISTAMSIYNQYCADNPVATPALAASTTTSFDSGGEASSPSGNGDDGTVTIYQTHLTIVTATTATGSSATDTTSPYGSVSASFPSKFCWMSMWPVLLGLAVKSMF